MRKHGLKPRHPVMASLFWPWALLLSCASVTLDVRAGHPTPVALYLASAALVATLGLAIATAMNVARQAVLWNRGSTIALLPTLVLIIATIVLTHSNAERDPAFSEAVRLSFWLGVVALVVRMFHRILYPDLPVDGLLWGRTIPFNPPAHVTRTCALAQAQKSGPAQTHDEPNVKTAEIRYKADSSPLTFNDVLGMNELKAALMDAAGQYAEHDKNGVLLHGAPGGGKTMIAKAFAGELGMPIIGTSIGEMASKWVNETTQNLGQLFRDAIAQAPCVLFIDEIDSLVSERVKGGGYEENKNIVAAFLTGAVDIRSHEVLLIGATNLLDHLDPAAIREGRFDFKIEITMPDAAARRGLILKPLGEYGATVDHEVLERLVRRWAGFNVPRILEVATRACGNAGLTPLAEDGARNGTPPTTLGWASFYQALRQVQGRKAGVREGAKRMSELFLDPDARQRLEGFATQLREIDQVEVMGGSIPRGLVFYGPPGTGKTTVAAALAAECGWSFISRSGSDLFENGAVDELQKQASDLRPAIVFLDEADDILANRSRSGYKSVTNKILTLVDGAGGNLPDVVWVAATNDIHSMDPAALRGGRFEQKILFGPPSGETLMAMLTDWTNRNRGFVVDDDAGDADAVVLGWVGHVAPIVTDMTLADLGSTLDAAKNIAVSRALMEKRPKATIRIEDVRMAASEIRSQD